MFGKYCAKNNSTEEVKPENSLDSLVTNFVSYVGRMKGDKYNHEFDICSQTINDQLQQRLQEQSQERHKSGVELQLEKNDTRLEDLLKFGNELVNNIQVYNEKQELIQSQRKYRQKQDLQNELNAEEIESMKRFDEISAKWTNILNLKEPMAIFDELKKQKQLIRGIMENKDQLIKQYQDQLDRINEKYYLDQKKQLADINFMIERIDGQIDLLKKAYKHNIDGLQETIECEKRKIYNEWENQWDILYDALTIKEMRKLEIAKEKRRFYTDELQKICKKQEEITRATKIRLEKNAELLEIELRKTRANILMNSEKIDYNYQVLQKRNEENVILTNQKKRRVAKYKESIGNLKHKLNFMCRNNMQTIDRLSADIQKLHDSINDLHSKAQHFRTNNIKKFNKVWQVNFQEIKELWINLTEIDRILYEQQLLQKWEKPLLDLDKLDLTRNVLTHLNNPKTKSEYNENDNETEAEKKKTKIKHAIQLHDILLKISDRAGFLVESKLFNILKPYTDVDKDLVRIENIFAALHITDIQMVESLIKFFEPHSYCPNCSSNLNNMKTLYTFNEGNLFSELKSEKQKESDCPNHYMVMEPTLVLSALNDYTTFQYYHNGKFKSKKNLEEDINLLAISVEDIQEYWSQFDVFISAEKKNVWKTIEHGLNHYLEILKTRERLDSECVFLEKQNVELQYFLKNL